MFRSVIHKSPHLTYIPIAVAVYIYSLIPPNQPPPKPFNNFVIPSIIIANQQEK